MLDNTFGLLGFSYAVIGRRSNLMLRAAIFLSLSPTKPLYISPIHPLDEGGRACCYGSTN